MQKLSSFLRFIATLTWARELLHQTPARRPSVPSTRFLSCVFVVFVFPGLIWWTPLHQHCASDTLIRDHETRSNKGVKSAEYRKKATRTTGRSLFSDPDIKNTSKVSPFPSSLLNLISPGMFSSGLDLVKVKNSMSEFVLSFFSLFPGQCVHDTRERIAVFWCKLQSVMSFFLMN